MKPWTLSLLVAGPISTAGIVFATERQCDGEMSLSDALAEPRREIDELDEVLVLILLQRSRLVAKIGEIKAKKRTDGQTNVRDNKRESEKMIGVKETCNRLGATKHEVTFIQTCIRNVIEVSVQSQQPVDLSPFVNYSCSNCGFRTAGIRDNPLKWPTCPACYTQLTTKVG